MNESKMQDAIVTPATQNNQYDYYEFFSGGGMARLGLGSHWRCLLANDFSKKKAMAYRANFPPAHELIQDDVWNLTVDDLPGEPVLSWASFPCQDLSLAGNGQGLTGERSGSYWGFWRLMQQLQDQGRPTPLIVLENVVGTITANQGNDFRLLLESLVNTGYSVGPLVIDAVHFVPQSRPRLFIVAALRDIKLPTELALDSPTQLWHPKRLQMAYQELPEELRQAWVWWNLPRPQPHHMELTELIEENPDNVEWHTPSETQRLLDLMTPLHRNKVRKAQTLNRKIVGTIYRRIRRDANNVKAQRAEIRFDQVSGCLRTGSGGSSRQFIMVVEGDRIRSRLLSSREAARLMGLPDSYLLPEKYTEAYHLVGDGLVTPVVSWLERHILRPLAARCTRSSSAVVQPVDQPIQQSLALVEIA